MNELRRVMKRVSHSYAMSFLAVLLAGVILTPKAPAQNGATGIRLRGVVSALDGKPLAGVTVSIRGEGQTFVTSVFTNSKGVYVFPSVEKGLKYSLWAQAQ